LLLTVAGTAFGQVPSGNLYGRVTDDEGAVLQGAKVTLSGGSEPQIRVTNAHGNFIFLGLSPGTYALTAALDGYSTVEYPNIVINVGRNTTIEVTLSAAIEQSAGSESRQPDAQSLRQTFACEAITRYENRNQVDDGPLVLSTLSGQVFAEVGNPAKPLGPFPNACIGLFSEGEHKLVSNTVANKDGSFSIRDVPPGSYRLVVRDSQNAFCVANAPIRMSEPKERARGGRVVIHLRPAGIDDCSYANYK
jgi:hypothetical protein